MRFLAFVLVLAALTLPALAAFPAAPLPVGQLLHELRAFGETGRVLYVAAHPDDENTRLIAYLARGRGYRTGYLSLTRGDGGQNLIGSELRDALGLIRTQELLAARSIDGGVQFFTRANDFGFSKNPEETLTLWDREAVLADMVRVIRTFRPDVLITRFPPEAGGTHGHHTASAQLAIEAFHLAADPAAFREQLAHLPPWQATRVVWNAWVGRGGLTPDGLLRLDVGGYDPLLGESYGEIAARSRTMHKSQGFGAVGSRGEAFEYFRHLAGEPATHDLFDGVDTSWTRLPGGEAIGRKTREVLQTFDPLQPAASVPALAELHRQLAALGEEPVVVEKRRQLDRIIAACLGLHVQTTVARAEVVPGESLTLRQTAIVRSEVPVTWRSIAPTQDLPANEPVTVETTTVLPPETLLSHPYWLRSPGTPGLFAVDEPELIGRPDNPPLLPLRHRFAVAGVEIELADAPMQVIDDPVRGEVRLPLRAIPPVTVTFAQDLHLFAPKERRTVLVDVTSARAGASGRVSIEAPPGWQVSPQHHAFAGNGAGSHQRFAFDITAAAAATTGDLTAAVTVDGRPYRSGRVEIRYEHIPPQLLQPTARARVVSLTLDHAGERVGYVPGAGDLVPAALQRLGYTVVTIPAEQLTAERLRGLDAVVLGIRALNTQPALAARLPALFAYAETGGTVVMQYHTTGELPDAPLAPYPLRLSRERVTEENAEVTLLAPDHPALNRPNRITTEDFAGWVQERGLYFAGEWDEAFTPLLSAADQGEPQRAGGLLVARHGDGWFVYTGISFFRQLPEGVPGAYRLFANLVSLSAAATTP